MRLEECWLDKIFTIPGMYANSLVPVVPSAVFQLKLQLKLQKCGNISQEYQKLMIKTGI